MIGLIVFVAIVAALVGLAVWAGRGQRYLDPFEQRQQYGGTNFSYPADYVTAARKALRRVRRLNRHERRHP